MFWAFFRDCQYDEHLWPVVWATECAIVSTIAAEHDRLQDVDMAELEEILRSYLEPMGFPARWNLSDVPPAWVDSFLDEHLGVVYEFVQTLGREFVPASKSLGFRQERLFRCIRESESLCTYFRELEVARRAQHHRPGDAEQ